VVGRGLIAKVVNQKDLNRKEVVMKRAGASFVLFSVLMVSWLGAAYGADQKVMLMLGGTYCDLYLGDVESALKKLTGIKAVDFKSMKGHAIVTLEGNKTTSNQLAQAVNGVKGNGWHCSAEVMK
jgi:copper chaperone CopZ